MDVLLVIDQDRNAMQTLGLACLERDVGVAMAETLCEGVRVLLSRSASLVVVDVALLRMTPPEIATLFERVAPGVPVIVVVHSDTPLETRVGFELLGFQILTRPVVVEDLIEKETAGAVGA
jgi:DNA-binding response OmpR family regulator